VLWAEDDALIVLRVGQPSFSRNRVIDSTDQFHRLHRTPKPRSGQIPPSGVSTGEGRGDDNQRCHGNHGDRHPEEYQS